MPSFALTRQRGLASKDLKIRDFLQKNAKKHCSFIYLTSSRYLDWTEMKIGNEKAAKYISRSSASTASATSSTCSTASVSLNQDLLKLRPPQSRNYFHFIILGKTTMFDQTLRKSNIFHQKLFSLSQLRRKRILSKTIKFFQGLPENRGGLQNWTTENGCDIFAHCLFLLSGSTRTTNSQNKYVQQYTNQD